MERLTAAQLDEKRRDGTYEDYVRSVMTDFCLTIDRHTGRERTWFGAYTLTVNRNVAFCFFDRDVEGDPGLEPYPVVAGESSRDIELRVQPEATDPSSAYRVPAFVLGPGDFEAAVESMERILAEYPGLRTLPDSYFPEEPIVRLLHERLLRHPSVVQDREGDWPPLLL